MTTDAGESKRVQSTDSVAEEGAPGVDELSETDRHRLLTSKRRRTVLDVLAGRTAPVDLEDLAARVAGGGDGAGASAERVAVQLHHAHLPKLAKAGVIDYDPETKRVSSCPARADSPTE